MTTEPWPRLTEQKPSAPNPRELLDRLNAAVARAEAAEAREREACMDALAAYGQAQESYKAQKAAEAETDALRAKLEALQEALDFYASLPREWVIDATPAGSSTPLLYGSLATLGERARAALALLDAPKGEGE